MRLLTGNSNDDDNFDKQSTCSDNKASERGDDFVADQNAGIVFKTTPYRWLVLAVVGLCIVV